MYVDADVSCLSNWMSARESLRGEQTGSWRGFCVHFCSFWQVFQVTHCPLLQIRAIQSEPQCLAPSKLQDWLGERVSSRVSVKQSLMSKLWTYLPLVKGEATISVTGLIVFSAELSMDRSASCSRQGQKRAASRPRQPHWQASVHPEARMCCARSFGSQAGPISVYWHIFPSSRQYFSGAQKPLIQSQIPVLSLKHDRP